MKKIRQNYLSSAIIAALIMSGCAGLTKMRDDAANVGYQVDPNPLETHAGEVAVTIDTRFPEKYFNKKAVVVATPVLRSDGNETEFSSTTLQGEKVDANNKVILYAGGNYTYTGSIPYDENMMKSELVVKMSAQIGDKTPVVFESRKIADGVIATSTLVQVEPKAIILPDSFRRVIPETYMADIHYVINQSNVRSSELKSEDIQNLQKDIVKADTTPNMEIKGAQISAYASPDGPMDLNEKLSQNRESSAQRYLEKVFADDKVTAAEAANFLSMMATPEDWQGFSELMQKSDIQDKDLILRVLSMYSDPVVREREIKNISEAYKEIAEKILPQLRRSVLKVNVDVIGKSDSEILDLAQNNPDSLNMEEILYAATLTDDLNKKVSIYQAATRSFPNSVRAFNNLGVVYLEMGQLQQARTALASASKLASSNMTVTANMGALALAEGNIDNAEQMLTSAMSAGSEVSYDLGIIKIKQADYSAAVNYFGNEASFNAALAQLLNSNNDRALATLNQLGETKDAMVYYLKAVINQREGNTSAVYSNLRSAVSLDPSLKEYAAKDAEFLGLEGDQTFGEITM